MASMSRAAARAAPASDVECGCGENAERAVADQARRRTAHSRDAVQGSGIARGALRRVDAVARPERAALEVGAERPHRLEDFHEALPRRALPRRADRRSQRDDQESWTEIHVAIAEGPGPLAECHVDVPL